MLVTEMANQVLPWLLPRQDGTFFLKTCLLHWRKSTNGNKITIYSQFTTPGGKEYIGVQYSKTNAKNYEELY